MRRDDLSAERLQMGDQGVGDGDGAAAGARPAGRVSGQRERDAERSRTALLERQERVRGTAGPERARTCGAEALRDRHGRPEPLQAESREYERMPRQQADRTEDLVEEVPGVRGERQHEAPPRLAVLAEVVHGGVERLFEGAGGPVIQRMRDRGRGVTPFQAVTCKRKAPEER